MPEFPDVVRAPPERVWQALIDPAQRLRGGFLVEAALEGGRPGEVDAVALYRTETSAWRERVLEADAPRRLLVEERDPAHDRTRATMVWRITPIKMGSLLVLEVHGKGTGDAARVRLLERKRYRRLVEAVKVSCEGPPAVRFPPPPKRGLPFLRRRPRAPEDAPGPPSAAPEPAAPTEPAPSVAEPVPEEPPKPKKGKPTKTPPKRRPKK